MENSKMCIRDRHRIDCIVIARDYYCTAIAIRISISMTVLYRQLDLKESLSLSSFSTDNFEGLYISYTSMSSMYAFYNCKKGRSLNLKNSSAQR